MTPLRVLRLIARMNVGGPAFQVSVLDRDLDRSRFEHRLLVGSVGPDEEEFTTLRGRPVRAVVVPGLGRAVRPADDLRALRAVLDEIRRFRPHIVHTHTAKAGVIGRVAARLSGVPVTVHTYHGHLLRGYFGPMTTSAVVQVERLLARSTDRLIAVGAQVERDLLAAGIGQAAKFRVVPPGIEVGPPPAKAEARRVLGLPGDAPIVAFSGRLTSVKRPDRLLAVAERLSGRFPIILVIAGEGDLFEMVKAEAAERPYVRVLGWRQDVETLYAASDVVLLTSDNEGMPVSLIEAALVGRPAVTTDVGSASEVVQHGRTGLVVSQEPEAIADAVATLLEDAQLRAAMGHAARAHAEASFSVDRLVRDIETIYLEAAEELL